MYNMIKDELLDFVEWCRANKLKPQNYESLEKYFNDGEYDYNKSAIKEFLQ